MLISSLMLFVVLIIFIFAGFPIFIASILTGLIFLVIMDIPFSVAVIKMFGTTNSLALLAIPFFILAGNIMTRSHITDKLVNFANALMGHLKGGLGHVNIMASVLFSGIQGSGAADAAATGGVLIPAMVKQGYEKDYAVAVTTSSAMLSPIHPPSIAMILYASYTETPVAPLFLGGIIPAFLVAIFLMIVNGIEYRRRKYDFALGKFSIKYVAKTFVNSIGALIMPLIIVGGIVFGIVTPNEAGVLAVVYGLIYGFFISKKLKVKDLPGIFLDTAITVAVVMMSLAAAGVLSNILVRMHFQSMLLDFSVHTLQNRYLVTFFMMAVLLVVGLFLDPPVLLSMFSVVILTIGRTFGFDPVHYGVLMVIVMQLGAITPPAGNFLFICCGIAKLPLEQSVRALMPYLFVILLVVLLILFIPGIVTFIPSLMN